MGSGKNYRIKISYIKELGMPIKYKHFSKEKVARSVHKRIKTNKFFKLIDDIELHRFSNEKGWRLIK